MTTCRTPKLQNGRYLREGIFIPDAPLVTVVRSAITGVCDKHSHDFEELVMVINGDGWHIVGDSKEKISRGNVFVITEGIEHSYVGAVNLELINIEYDRRELVACAGDLKSCAGFHTLFSIDSQLCVGNNFKISLKLLRHQINKAVELVGEIERELQNKEAGFKTICQINFLRLVTLFSRTCIGSSESENEQLRWRLGHVLAFLENNYASSITTEKMAEIANLSVRQFFRVFHSATGQPPLNYLLNIRMEKAMQMLLNTDLPICEIAFRIGIDDSNYFSRAFKKITGRTPSSFR